MRKIRERSETLNKLVLEGRIAVLGALYDVSTGEVSFFQTTDSSTAKLDVPMVATV